MTDDSEQASHRSKSRSMGRLTYTNFHRKRSANYSQITSHSVTNEAFTDCALSMAKASVRCAHASMLDSKKEALVTDFHLAQIDEGGWGATIVYLGAPLETSHVPRLPICCDAGKALSPTVGLEALPWREQRRQRTASGKFFRTNYF